MLSELFQRRNLGATNWDDFEIRTFTYNENDYLIQELKQRVVSGSWRNNLLTTNTYDQNGNMLTQLMQLWNNTSMTWTNISLVTRTYDANNNPISFLDHFWSGGTWKSTTLNLSTFDENGNRLTTLVQSWTNGEWRNAFFLNYTRGLDGNLLLLTMERWVMGGMSPIQLALVEDGNTTVFGSGSGYAHVYYSDVAEHLAHGDLLGPCGTDHSCTDFKTTPVEAIHIEFPAR